MTASKPQNPPAIEIGGHDPLQDYFDDRGRRSYSVARLVDEAKGLKPFDVPVAALDLSGCIWDGSDMLDLAWHIKRVNEADLGKPIIISWDGGVADGRHRIIKALLEGHRTIKAVRLMNEMTPDK